MPCDSKLETGSELAEHFGFAAEVIRLRMDSESIGGPGCEGYPFRRRQKSHPTPAHA